MDNKEKMRELMEAIGNLEEAPMPEDWQLQEQWKIILAAAARFYGESKKLDRMLEEGHYPEDTNTHWLHALLTSEEVIETMNENGLLG